MPRQCGKQKLKRNIGHFMNSWFWTQERKKQSSASSVYLDYLIVHILGNRPSLFTFPKDCARATHFRDVFEACFK